MELLLLLSQFLAELVGQLILQLLMELGLRSAIDVADPPRTRVSLAVVGYFLLGAAAGGCSLWLMPERLIEVRWLRLANLVLAPLIAGGAMAALGAWRRRRGQELIRLDHFGYGFLFAFAFVLVRYYGAD